jgi:hypothetical protein
MKKNPCFAANSLGCVALIFCAFAFAATPLRAADHGDSPTSSNNASADLADVFLYLNPSDNSHVILEATVRGFIVPGEAVNMAIFDPEVTYQFAIEETGDSTPDAVVNVTFSPRTSTASGQAATIRMLRGNTKVFEFTAPATPPNLKATAPAQVVTADPSSGVKFFAGEVDDPFFFDIPAFGRFVASVLAGAPDPSQFSRARDTFAGYNTMAIALDIPAALLQKANNVVGLEAVTYRAGQFTPTLLANMATRGKVDTGDNVLIGGVIIAGQSLKRVMIRAIGPSSGVNGALADPTLTLFDNDGHQIGVNDDWQSNQSAEITATQLAPKSPKESAIIATLAPGAYTAVVAGAGGSAGIAVVEAYDLDINAASTSLRQIDREGVPAVNVVTIPVARKDEYNGATPQQDAAGRFAGDIVATLKSLGTSDANIGVLAEVAVNHGDFLRLNLTTASSGPGGGNNANAGFPNGRRLGDDVIDTLLSIVTNGAVTKDNVNANDVALRDVFPFFALSQQPRDNGVIDDNTRN